MADEEKLRHYLKKATGELQRTARKLHEVELKDSEPIAIVGMSCRFPGAVRSAADLWQLVLADGDGISPFPADRGWGTVSLTSSDHEMAPDPAACQGGFVADADQFDAEFFGIAAQEALAMDPQQRLLLETAWEAVEHAGLDPVSLRGSQTGVYVGVSHCNYAARLAATLSQATLPEAVEDHLMVGGAPSTTSGRVAYVMGLRGPAISIDTACSSSLVAIHLASQGLRRGDCQLALAGGVAIMATPDVIVEFSRRGALASNGRCKPFAAAADGMGFGEGVGLLVLERLSTALRDGHPVLALIRGSAVNQDGATNGLTSPSRAAQEAVIRQALADARLTPDQVDAVEGHGAGTALGDSIEGEAVIATYGETRTTDRPLLLGSVKSNIGHTQAASGVAGVIKMVMSIRAGTHARTLHIDRPSTYVDWTGGKVALTTEPAPWPGNGRPRRAGVSSFGISGTNAHLILEEAPPHETDTAEAGTSAPSPPDADRTVVPWVLSAKTERALRAMVAQLSDFITAHPEVAVADVGISLARTRAGFKHRAVSLGVTHGEHLAALAALAGGERAPGLVTDEATGTADGVLARLARAYTAGTAVSWEAAFAGTGARQVRLPGYPFQRKRYWLDAPQEPEHPLLGGMIDLADSTERWFTRTLTAREPWYIAQYRLCGVPALPPAAVAEWALAASRHDSRESGNSWTIENLTFGAPITFPGKLPLAVQAVAETHGAARLIRGFSENPRSAERDRASRAERDWTRRFTALATKEDQPAPGRADLDRQCSQLAEQDPGSLFARHSESGIDYGPAFRHITRRWQSADESLVFIEADAAIRDGDQYVLHPVVLQTCLLSATPLVCDSGLWLPSGLARLTCYRKLPGRLWCHARRTQDGSLRLELFSESGEPLVVIAGLTCDAADPAQFASLTAAAMEPRTSEPWDADELSRLALEEPEKARQTLLDTLFSRVTALIGGSPDSRQSLREQFGSARLSELGLDSLRVMRLRDQFRAQLLVDVPPQRLLGDATVADIVDMVCRFLAARNLVLTADERPGTAGPSEEFIL